MLDATRIQLIRWPTLLLLPLTALAAVVALGAASGYVDTAGRLILLWLVVAFAYSSVVMDLFPLALGLGATRRDCYTATLLLSGASSMVLGVLLLALDRIAASGVLPGRSLGPGLLPGTGLLLTWLGYGVPILAVSVVSVSLAVVRLRWGKRGGMVVAMVAGMVAGTVAGSLDGSPVGWRAALDAHPAAWLVATPMLVALGLGAAGWLVLRRATP
ncbi:MAG TPA: hypothetical protein VD813_08580 [Pseudonocardia sp.]|nr:hypothetical protein [Pseudonocardia sp.]